MVDYKHYANSLIVKPVFRMIPENDTGYLTPPELYTNYVPFSLDRLVIHATVGTNTLPYFADKVDHNWNVTLKAGSIRDGRYVCAHQLIPSDDYTIYDMVPPNFGCGHANPGSWRGESVLNYHSYGIEVENMQTVNDPFEESQYIKLALTIAYRAAVTAIKLKNIFIATHWDISMGSILDLAAKNDMKGTFQRARNAHTDPYKGLFDPGRFWGHLFAIRQPENWPWPNIPLYEGR